MTYACTEGSGMDDRGNDCDAITADPALCGTADTLDPVFVSTDECCGCGGGTVGAASTVAADDTDME